VNKCISLLPGVDLLHLDFGVDVAVVQEIYVGGLDLWDAVAVDDHAHDVFQRQQRVTLDFGVNVFAFRDAKIGHF
jgi:hypothetical protein